VAVWAPETADDLVRIWEHVSQWTSIEAADATIEQLLDVGERLRPSEAIRSAWPGIFKRWVLRRRYLLVIRTRDREIEILGVFGRKEAWFRRMSGRL
jgi:plasmid stabilization system protein ParE